ncbi:hypothetical protein NL676_022433 [Syzygium grande]|nr:hypothetical protein NL676_022433 [Syzygium grande]
MIPSQRIAKSSPLETINYELLDGSIGGNEDSSCICNPTTKESRILYSSKLVPRDKFFHGFGYDPTSDDYKIVQGNGTKNYQVATFSLKSSSWRRIQVQQESHLADDRGVFWERALHWCGVDQSQNKKETAIMSFDLAYEKFHQVLSVPEVGGDRF